MTESLPKGECFMKNGEITVRFAAENEIARVNELREQVSRLHAENRPDVFRSDFCNELRQIAKNASLKGLNRMYGVLTGTPFGSVKPQDLKHTGNIWR
jgi:hypothetical protein